VRVVRDTRLPTVVQQVVDEGMRAYYERRAPEYDDWWDGTGLFAERDRPGWSDEVAALVAVIVQLAPARVLDVACGTGFLTQHLRGAVTGLDQSAQMLAVAAARMPSATFVKGDAVPLPFADGTFDRIFTSHFYGHLLPSERTRFLAEARRAGRELVVVDSARRAGVPADEWQERALNDGSAHRVYKRFLRGSELIDELGGGAILHEDTWFVAVAA
jgi:ubiquinone/menaquinone biosynthesis C-methylase UbiE